MLLTGAFLIGTGADRLLSLFLIDDKKLTVPFNLSWQSHWPLSAISLATLVDLVIVLPFLMCFLSVSRAEAISRLLILAEHQGQGQRGACLAIPSLCKSSTVCCHLPKNRALSNGPFSLVDSFVPLIPHGPSCH